MHSWNLKNQYNYCHEVALKSQDQPYELRVQAFRNNCQFRNMISLQCIINATKIDSEFTLIFIYNQI